MKIWEIEQGIDEITHDYVSDFMPEGTTEIVIPEVRATK